MQIEKVIDLMVRTQKKYGLIKTQEEEETERKRLWQLAFPKNKEPQPPRKTEPGNPGNNSI